MKSTSDSSDLILPEMLDRECLVKVIINEHMLQSRVSLKLDSIQLVVYSNAMDCNVETLLMDKLSDLVCLPRLSVDQNEVLWFGLSQHEFE